MDVTYPSCRCPRSSGGYSLIETAASLAIGAIITGMAIPAFSDLVNDNQQNTLVNRLVGSLHYARSEAVKRNLRVNVCKTTDGIRCNASAQWNDGWMVFVDLNADKQREASELMLQVTQLNLPQMKVNYHAFPSSNYIVFYPTGITKGNGTFVFCDERGDEAAHALVLYKTGRLRSATTMPDGGPLSCS